MWKTLFNRPFLHTNKEKGQSIIILAFSFVGLIALLGLAIDLGMVYIERTSLGRAIDASVLSGVTELANEEEATVRTIEYLALNDYDIDNDSNVYVRGCVSDVKNWFNADGSFCGSINCGNDHNPLQLINAPSGGAPADWYYPYHIVDDNDDNVTNIFWINTYKYQTNHANACSGSSLGEANKISITGTVKVDMSFFQLLGWQNVPVTTNATAQNLDSIDAVVVLDRSGSMEFDPVCYGCWERRDRLPTNDPDYRSIASTASDNPRYSGYYEYPENGVIYPLGFSDGFSNINRVKACTTPTYDADQDLPVPQDIYSFNYNDTFITDGNYHYSIIEAELYSLNPNPADPELQEQGKGYWAMQRGEGNYGNENTPYYDSTGTSIDALGAHMAYHPSLVHSGDVVYGKHATLADAASGNSPWLEYDFHLYQDPQHPSTGWSTGDSGYIWLRAHVGRGLDVDDGDWRDSNFDKAYWALTTVTDTFAIQSPPTTGIHNMRDLTNPPNHTRFPADSKYWRWIRVANFTIDTDANYRFYIFAGSAGYSIDRIVITDNPHDWGNNGDGGALDNARTHLATAASAYRAACDICNPLYAENISDVNNCTFYPTLKLLNVPTNNRLDPLFDEWEMPLRKSKEAIKFFISRLDPDRDQAGFVSYNSSSSIKTELACKRSDGVNCSGGANPISYTNVLKGVEDTRASNATPTANGLFAGLQVLGIGSANNNCTGINNGTQWSNSSCSRGGGAQKVLILLTDGQPNSTHFYNIDGCSDATAPPWDGISSDEETQASYRCPLYLADQAKQNGVTVYTIGLGFGVDRDWLKEIARLGNGQAYFSASGGDLAIIFNQILSNIYVRLIE